MAAQCVEVFPEILVFLAEGRKLALCLRYVTQGRTAFASCLRPGHIIEDKVRAFHFDRSRLELGRGVRSESGAGTKIWANSVGKSETSSDAFPDGVLFYLAVKTVSWQLCGGPREPCNQRATIWEKGEE